MFAGERAFGRQMERFGAQKRVAKGTQERWSEETAKKMFVESTL